MRGVFEMLVFPQLFKESPYIMEPNVIYNIYNSPLLGRNLNQMKHLSALLF